MPQNTFGKKDSLSWATLFLPNTNWQLFLLEYLENTKTFERHYFWRWSQTHMCDLLDV
jgi:hypothetical protein